MLQEVRWSCINGGRGGAERNGRDGWNTDEGGEGKGGTGRRAAAVGRVLTELINELALRDKA